MADNDIKIDVIVNTDNATRQFEKLDTELKDVKKSTENLSTGFTALEKKIITADAAFRLSAQAASLVAKGLGAIPDAVKQGAEIDDVTDAFNKLTSSAGSTARTLLNQLNSATLSTISNFELMRKANLNLRAGLKPDEIVTFTKAAKILSDQTGSDLTQSLDNLTQAFRTGRLASLQGALGLITVEQAGNKLDTALASRSVLLQTATGFIQKYGESSKDAGDLLQGLTKTFEDARNEIYLSLANNKELNTALQQLGSTISQIDITPLITGINTVVSATSNAVTRIIELTDLFKTLFSGSSVELTKLEKIFGGDFFKRLNNSQGKLDGSNITNSVFNSAIDFASIGGNKNTTSLPQNLNIGKQAAEKLRKELDQVTKSIYKLTGFDAYPKLTQQIKESLAAAEGHGAEELANELRILAENAQKAGIPLDEVTDRIQSLQEAGKKAAEDAANNQSFGSSLFASIFGINPNATSDQLQSQFADQMASAIQGALSQVSQAIQGGGVNGGAIGATIGSIAGGVIGAGFGAGGAIVGSQLGAGLGEVLGSVWASVLSSENTPGTKARKAADKFFADVFDENRLSVVIKGQLVKINDLVFRGDTLFNGNSDFGDGSFSNYFNSLTDGVKQAFEGVGRAFEEIIGNSEDFAGQLGAIFANNIGGDLNNLQLLVQATGKSFEELGQAIEKAFQKGNLSAVQAQQSFAQLNQLAKPGVPGQKGAANTAFRNLLNAGAKGGNATLDALKDIGAEGLELGITSISQLREVFQQYVRSGQFSQKEVNVLFKALDNLNIKTTQQLSSANNNTLIALAAQLESTGVLKVIDGIVEQITKLPSEKTIKIKVDTQFTGDRSAAKVAGIYADGTRSSSVSAR